MEIVERPKFMRVTGDRPWRKSGLTENQLAASRAAQTDPLVVAAERNLRSARRKMLLLQVERKLVLGRRRRSWPGYAEAEAEFDNRRNILEDLVSGIRWELRQFYKKAYDEQLEFRRAAMKSARREGQRKVQWPTRKWWHNHSEFDRKTMWAASAWAQTYKMLDWCATSPQMAVRIHKELEKRAATEGRSGI